jgi:hypothetical protein
MTTVTVSIATAKARMYARNYPISLPRGRGDPSVHSKIRLRAQGIAVILAL